jgi:hypothetical protein
MVVRSPLGVSLMEYWFLKSSFKFVAASRCISGFKINEVKSASSDRAETFSASSKTTKLNNKDKKTIEL